MVLKIVLADDHVVVRDGLRLILESELGMTVVGEAADGRSVGLDLPAPDRQAE